MKLMIHKQEVNRVWFLFWNGDVIKFSACAFDNQHQIQSKQVTRDEYKNG